MALATSYEPCEKFLKWQDFKKIKETCLKNHKLFEDPTFPAEHSSISKDPNYRISEHIEWLRPMEISENARFVVNGFDRFYVVQGGVGDCWILAPIANLTLHKELLEQVVPKNQGFDSDYAGVFHFFFWQYNDWIDVVIDDRLPTIKGADNKPQLLYLSSADKNEFWSSLLEKAYAKLHGSYTALFSGYDSKAMIDCTGGIAEIYMLSSDSPQIEFDALLQFYERNSLMCCSIDSDPEKVGPFGLIHAHSYSVTDVRTIDANGRTIKILRLRNPWGNNCEWTGPWSANSRNWKTISKREQKKMNFKPAGDGEFWMSFKDFKKYFSTLKICNIASDSLRIKVDLSFYWETHTFEGKWTLDGSAGGSTSYWSFCKNPQYLITLTDPDGDTTDDCTLIVSLSQKLCQENDTYLCIAFSIHLVPARRKIRSFLSCNDLLYNSLIAHSGSYKGSRDISMRFHLPPGRYLIIPSTEHSNQAGQFLLRVLTEKRAEMVDVSS